jgi:hypothetical protein
MYVRYGTPNTLYRIPAGVRRSHDKYKIRNVNDDERFEYHRCTGEKSIGKHKDYKKNNMNTDRGKGRSDKRRDADCSDINRK